MADTKQTELTRDEKGRITGGPPPNGFNKNPQNRHNGAWKKEDTARYKLEKMMQLSATELLEVVNDSSRPLFEQKIAQAIIDGKWLVVREMIDQVYGKPKESVDMTSKGESINPYAALTTEELRKLAGK